jgi:hypothetical protein
MEIKNEHVTLSLQSYEDMKQEAKILKEQIKILKEQVKEKTVVKYYVHPVYGYVTLALLAGCFYWFIILNPFMP